MVLNIINYIYVYIYTHCIKRNTTLQSLLTHMDNLPLPFIAYCTILSFVSSHHPPLTLVTIQKYFTTIHTFFLTYYRWCVSVAKVVGEGNVTFFPSLTLYERTTNTTSASYGSGYCFARRLVTHHHHTYARILEMITLTEELFASLVIGSKSYIIVDEETKCAIENSDYGSEHMVCENNPDTVGWAGPALGQVHTVEGELYRLWKRSEWIHVGKLSRKRAAKRNADCAQADARIKAATQRTADATQNLRKQLLDTGIKPDLIDKLPNDMKPEDLAKTLGLT